MLIEMKKIQRIEFNLKNKLLKAMSNGIEIENPINRKVNSQKPKHFFFAQ